jgi:hypothetical protein
MRLARYPATERWARLRAKEIGGSGRALPPEGGGGAASGPTLDLWLTREGADLPNRNQSVSEVRRLSSRNAFRSLSARTKKEYTHGGKRVSVSTYGGSSEICAKTIGSIKAHSVETLPEVYIKVYLRCLKGSRGGAEAPGPWCKPLRALRGRGGRGGPLSSAS